MHVLVCLQQSIAAGRVMYLDIMTVSTGLLCEKGPRDVILSEDIMGNTQSPNDKHSSEKPF